MAVTIRQTELDNLGELEAGRLHNASAKISIAQGEEMRPVKLTIAGSFWDSQIYSGELILIEDDGAINRIDWRQAVDSIADQNDAIQTAVRVAFSDSDLFYNPKVRKILLDPQIADPIKSQLVSLAAVDLSCDDTDWSQFWRTEKSPFNFLPIDTEVYYNQFFACGDEGLFSTSRSAISQKGLAQGSTKHHDARIFQVRASDKYTAVAAAAGDDGLVEFPFNRSDTEDVLGRERWLAKKPCSACEWAFQSVVGWTQSGAFLAQFREEKERNSSKTVRIFDRVLGSDDFFKNPDQEDLESFSWGAREKLYRLTDEGIEVTDYRNAPTKRRSKSQAGGASEDSLFDSRGVIKGAPDPRKVVSTGTAPFGAVIELNDQITVIRSDGVVDVFPGEPVHWRVFPRSEHYSNQLHIVYEDRLEIISFVHDYFVNQKNKLAGFARSVTDDLSEMH